RALLAESVPHHRRDPRPAGKVARRARHRVRRPRARGDARPRARERGAAARRVDRRAARSARRLRLAPRRARRRSREPPPLAPPPPAPRSAGAARITIDGATRTIDVPAHGTGALLVPLGAKELVVAPAVPQARAEREFGAFIARVERPALRPWTRPPPDEAR